MEKQSLNQIILCIGRPWNKHNSWMFLLHITMLNCPLGHEGISRDNLVFEACRAWACTLTLRKKCEENEKVTVKTSFKTDDKEFIIYFKYGGKQFLADGAINQRKLTDVHRTWSKRLRYIGETQPIVFVLCDNMAKATDKQAINPFRQFIGPFRLTWVYRRELYWTVEAKRPWGVQEENSRTECKVKSQSQAEING